MATPNRICITIRQSTELSSKESPLLPCILRLDAKMLVNSQKLHCSNQPNAAALSRRGRRTCLSEKWTSGSRAFLRALLSSRVSHDCHVMQQLTPAKPRDIVRRRKNASGEKPMPVSDTSEIFEIGVEGGSGTFFREPDPEAGYLYFYSVSKSFPIDEDFAEEEDPHEQRSSTPNRKGPFPTVLAALSDFSPDGEWVWYLPLRMLNGYRLLLWELRQNTMIQTGQKCSSHVHERWARKCGVSVMKKPEAVPLRRMPRSEVVVVTLGFEGGKASVRCGTTAAGARYFTIQSQSSGGFDGDIPDSVRSRKIRTRTPLFTSLKEAMDSIAGPSIWLAAEPLEINADFLDGLKTTFAEALAGERTSAFARDHASLGWQSLGSNEH